MSRRAWTDAEDAVMRARYPDEKTEGLASALGRSLSSIHNRAHFLGLKKSPEFLASESSGRANLLKAGKKHRFHSGQKPWNAGKQGWQAGGRAGETQFKAGNKPHTHKPVGSERTDKDGCLVRKVSDTGVKRNDWRLVHHLAWEAENGPIPAGHILVFRNGNRSDARLENLELITRAENARRNTIYRYPPELVRTMKAAARLRRKIQEIDP